MLGALYDYYLISSSRSTYLFRMSKVQFYSYVTIRSLAVAISFWYLRFDIY
jgi:hypothetical protein